VNRLPIESIVAILVPFLFYHAHPTIILVCSLANISSNSPLFRLNINKFPFLLPTAAYYPLHDIATLLVDVLL
jgi:hypothetical protein